MAAAIDLKTLKRAPPAGNAPAVFSIVRNERYFLPHFLAHYRALGVGLFVFYDDHSDDGTIDHLCAQPDCAVVNSDRAFGEDYGLDRHGAPRRLRQVLKETAADRLLPGRWVATVDADEFLVLPEWASTLPDLIARLEAMGQPYATAPMVDFYGETLKIEYPTGSGKMLTLAQVATELSASMTRLFLPGASGLAPCPGGDTRYADEQAWRDLALFHEYFDGDTGRGVGANHQTGWTALVASLLYDLGRLRRE